MHALAERFLVDLKSAPNFVCAFAIFLFFVRLDIGSVWWINAAARPAFAVYVAHQTPAFWPVLWPRILRTPDWWGGPWTPLLAVLAALAVYVAVAIPETLRLRLLEPRWTRTRLFSALAGAIDRLCGAPVPSSSDVREVS